MSDHDSLWWLLVPDTTASDQHRAPTTAVSADADTPLLNPEIARLFAATLDDAVPPAVSAVFESATWQWCPAPEPCDLRAALAASGAGDQLGKRAKRRLDRQLPTRVIHASATAAPSTAPDLTLLALLDGLPQHDALVLHTEATTVAFLREQLPALRQLALQRESKRHHDANLRAALAAAAARDLALITAQRYVIRSEAWPLDDRATANRVLQVRLSSPGVPLSGADLVARLAARDDYAVVEFNSRDDYQRERGLPVVSWGPAVARALLAGQSAKDLEAQCPGVWLEKLYDYDRYLLPKWLRPVRAVDRELAGRCVDLMKVHQEQFEQILAGTQHGQVARNQMLSPEGYRFFSRLDRVIDCAWWTRLYRRAQALTRTRLLAGIW